MHREIKDTFLNSATRIKIIHRVIRPEHPGGDIWKKKSRLLKHVRQWDLKEFLKDGGGWMSVCRHATPNSTVRDNRYVRDDLKGEGRRAARDLEGEETRSTASQYLYITETQYSR